MSYDFKIEEKLKNELKKIVKQINSKGYDLNNLHFECLSNPPGFAEAIDNSIKAQLLKNKNK